MNPRLKPGEFGYEFDVLPEEMTFGIDLDGSLRVTAPPGKRIGLNHVHLLLAAPQLLAALGMLQDACDRVREAAAINNPAKRGGLSPSQMAATLAHYAPVVRDALDRAKGLTR